MKKKILIKTLSALLTVVLLISAIQLGNLAALNIFATKASAKEYKVGDIVEFGSYPQTKVEDSSLISKLNSINAETKYRAAPYAVIKEQGDSYVCGTSEDASKWVEYKDVELNGRKYRHILIKNINVMPDHIRENSIMWSAMHEGDGVIDLWFEWEPIKWRIIDAEKGLAICETIIDHQPFSLGLNFEIDEDQEIDEFFVTPDVTDKYSDSYVNKWLNSTFIDSAFSEDEQKMLYEFIVDSTPNNKKPTKETLTKTKVGLPTFAQIVKPGEEKNENPIVKAEFAVSECSDYAEIFWNSNFYRMFYWYLATESDQFDLSICTVSPPSPFAEYQNGYDGKIKQDVNNVVDIASYGVRPVICLNGPETSSDAKTENADKPDIIMIAVTGAAIVATITLVTALIMLKSRKPKTK